MIKLLKKILKKNKNKNKKYNDKALCPLCDNTLYQDKSSLFCNNNECNFKITRNINDKKIDLETFCDFQNKVLETQHIYKDIHREALAVEEAENQKYKEMRNNRERIMLERLTKEDSFFKGSRMLDSSSLNCLGTPFRKGDTIKCSNLHCECTIKTTYGGITFSDEEMSGLMNFQISEEYLFTQENGSKVKGRVFFDFDENFKKIPEYRFVEDISKLPEIYFKCLQAPSKKNEKFKPLETLLQKK